MKYTYTDYMGRAYLFNKEEIQHLQGTKWGVHFNGAYLYRKLPWLKLKLYKLGNWVQRAVSRV